MAAAFLDWPQVIDHILFFSYYYINSWSLFNFVMVTSSPRSANRELCVLFSIKYIRASLLICYSSAHTHTEALALVFRRAAIRTSDFWEKNCQFGSNNQSPLGSRQWCIGLSYSFTICMSRSGRLVEKARLWKWGDEERMSGMRFSTPKQLTGCEDLTLIKCLDCGVMLHRRVCSLLHLHHDLISIYY